jgi:hypothetical protein
MFLSIALIVIGGAIVGGLHYWNQILPLKFGRQTEYAGLRLGMSQDEVMYVKGYPPFVLGEELKEPEWKGFLKVIDTKNLDKGKSVQDYSDWSYVIAEGNINVAFGISGGVAAIQCYSKDKLFRCPSLAGIKDGDRETETVHALGNPSEAKFSGITKSLTYNDLGIQLTLEKEAVYVLEVTAPGYSRR